MFVPPLSFPPLLLSPMYLTISSISPLIFWLDVVELLPDPSSPFPSSSFVLMPISPSSSIFSIPSLSPSCPSFFTPFWSVIFSPPLFSPPLLFSPMNFISSSSSLSIDCVAVVGVSSSVSSTFSPSSLTPSSFLPTCSSFSFFPFFPLSFPQIFLISATMLQVVLTFSFNLLTSSNLHEIVLSSSHFCAYLFVPLLLLSFLFISMLSYIFLSPP